jgi:hypothetical protein
MYDRNTDTLWHQLWGTPAFGPLVGSGIQLQRLPVILTTWEAWYAEHPETKVMDFSTGFIRDYRVGAAYLVVIYDSGGHGARAYERGQQTFTSAAKETTIVIVDKAGHTWQVTENVLVGPNEEKLARLPGHMAYWFGWFSFYPKTEVYGIEAN